MATKIQLRRDTASDWTSTNPTLAAGEFGWESDTNRFKIGDGATAWTSLAYASDGDTAGITFVGDDSTGTLVSQNETFKVAGTQNVTTAVSGDTLTVTGPDLSSYATGSSTTTFTNKTFDANGTGNSISNIETADIAAGTLVTAAEGIGSNNNDTTIPTSAAVKAYADSVGGGGGGTITALNNQAENRLVSIGSTTTELDGEANLTFDGSTLTLTGSAALDGVTIADNLITTNRSNDDLGISANGTGRVQIAGNGTFATGIGSGERNVLYHKNHAQTFGSRSYANLIEQDIKIDAGESDSSNTNDRYRNIMNVNLDLNGKDSTASSTFITRGPNNFVSVQPSNSGTGDSILGNAAANNNFIYASTSNTGDLTISLMASNTGSVEMSANTGSTVTFTDARVYNSNAEAYNGGGTENIGTLYHFKANAAVNFDSITNEYGFHTPDSMQSLIGGVKLQDFIVSASDGGKINLGASLANSTYSNYFGSASRIKGTALVYEDLAVNPNNLTDREIGHAIFQGHRLTASSTNSNFRPRNVVMGTGVDLDGFSYTNTSLFRGPLGAQINGMIQNSSATNATCNVVRGMETSAGVSDFNNAAGDINIVDAIGNFAANFYERDGSGDVNVTNSYSFYAKNDAYDGGGTGTFNATSVYGYYYAAATGFDTLTNEYAFYDAGNKLSRFGAVILANQSGDPSTVADSAHIYAKDVTSSSEVFVRDEAGNVTQISPHNEQGEWQYWSENIKTGKKVRVNMERMIRKLEEITGETFIENE